MRLYEILTSEKPDKIEKVGVRITSFYSFETVERCYSCFRTRKEVEK